MEISVQKVKKESCLNMGQVGVLVLRLILTDPQRDKMIEDESNNEIKKGMVKMFH